MSLTNLSSIDLKNAQGTPEQLDCCRRFLLEMESFICYGINGSFLNWDFTNDIDQFIVNCVVGKEEGEDDDWSLKTSIRIEPSGSWVYYYPTVEALISALKLKKDPILYSSKSLSSEVLAEFFKFCGTPSATQEHFDKWCNHLLEKDS